MNYSQIRASKAPLSISVLALATVLSSSTAAAIPMTGPDSTSFTLQQSSFNSGANWLGNAAPIAGQTYETAGNLLNSPWRSASSTFAGDRLTVTGTLALRASDGGIVRIDNNASNPGGLVLNGATVSAAAGGARPTLAGLMTLEGTSALNAVEAARGITVASRITGDGGLTIASRFLTGGEVLFANGINDYSGRTEVLTVDTSKFARLRAGAEGAFSPNSDIIVDAGSVVELDGHDNTIAGLAGGGTVENASATDAELTVQGGTNNSFSGSLQDGVGGGALSVRKAGIGTQILTTANSYTGGTTIEDGVLQVEDSGALGTGSVVVTGAGSGTLGLATSWTSPLTLEGRSSDTAHVNNVSGNNTLSGPLTLQETSTPTPDDPAVFTIESAADALTVSSNIAFTGSEDVVLNLGGASTAANTVSGNINLAGGGTNGDSLEKEGVGNWTVTGTISADSVTVNSGELTVANTLNAADGVTVVSGGTFRQQGSIIDRANQAGGFTNDGVVYLNGSSASMSAIAGTTSGATIDNTGATDATLTVGNVAGGDYAGSLEDSGAGRLSVAKDGSGTQGIGEIDIAGTVAVTDGILNVGTVTNAGDVTVSGDSTLGVSGTTNAGGLNVTDGTATLTGNATVGDVDVDSGSTASLNGDVNSAGAIDSDGTLTTGGDTAVTGAISITGGTATMGVGGGSVDVTDGDVAISGGASASIEDLETTAGTGGGVAVSGSGTSAILNGVSTGDDDISVTGGTANITSFTATTGDLEVQGGTVNLDGTGSFDAAKVQAGLLNVESSGALGNSGAGDDDEATSVSGTGRVNINGTSLAIDEVFNLFSRTDGSVQLNNVASANTISGQINLVDDDPVNGSDDTYTITSATGTMSLTGGIVSALTDGDRVLNLGGEGNGTVTGLTLADTNGDADLNKTGGGTWAISGADIDDANSITSMSGTLTLEDATSIDGDAIFDLAGGSLNVAGVTGGSSYDGSAFGGGGAFLVQSGQTLTGNGMVTGDIVMGGDLNLGDSFGEIVFDNLDLNGTMTIEVGGPQQGGLFSDLLTVNNVLDITDAQLVFDMVGSLTQNAYVFATYGSLMPGTGPFAGVSGVPTNWSVMYGYNSADQIALVRDDIPPVPAPAPLALIGLGALVWGRLRWRANREA